MADTKTIQSEERIYTIPLRAKTVGVPRTHRGRKAITIIGNFLMRHMKTDKVWIGQNLNEEIWARGMKKPPSKVRVRVLKTDGVARAELVGFEFPQEKITKEDAKKSTKKETKDEHAGHDHSSQTAAHENPKVQTELEEKKGAKPKEKKNGASVAIQNSGSEKVKKKHIPMHERRYDK